MNKKKYFLFSSLLIVLLGVIFHFAYDFFNQSKYIAFIFPINESIWEHLKLIFYPSLIIDIFIFVKFNKPIGYMGALAFSIFAGMIAVVGGYYLYRIFVDDIAIVNILLYVISVVCMQGILFNYTKIKPIKYLTDRIGVIVLIIMFFFLTIFTYYPPKAEIFNDPSDSVSSTCTYI